MRFQVCVLGREVCCEVCCDPSYNCVAGVDALAMRDTITRLTVQVTEQQEALMRVSAVSGLLSHVSVLIPVQSPFCRPSQITAHS